MNKLDKYRKKLKKLEQSDSYWAHNINELFVSELERILSSRDINKSQFAKLAGVSASYITRIMNGNANLSMESMAKLARSIGGVVHVHVAPRGVAVDWHDHYEISISGQAPFAPEVKAPSTRIARASSESTETSFSTIGV